MCEYKKCSQWRGVMRCSNNEGFFYLCRKHRERANNPIVRKDNMLTVLKVLKNGEWVEE